MEEIIFIKIYHGGILSEIYVPTYVGNCVPALRYIIKDHFSILKLLYYTKELGYETVGGFYGEVVNLGGEDEDVNLGEESEVVDLSGEDEDVKLGGESEPVNLGGEGVDDNLGGEGESNFLSSDSDLDIPSEDGSNIDEELRAFRQERRNKKQRKKTIEFEEIPVGEAGGIDRGFEDIGKNKTDKYAGKLGGDEDYIDSSDCWIWEREHFSTYKPRKFKPTNYSYLLIFVQHIRTQSSQQSSICVDTTVVPRTTQTAVRLDLIIHLYFLIVLQSTMGGPSHSTFKTIYATTQLSKPSFICADTTSVPRPPQNRVQVRTGRGLGKKKVNARRTSFATERDSPSSQLPPLSGHKRPYRNRRPATGFGVYFDPTTGAHVFNPGTSSEKILHRPTKLKNASPTNIGIGFKPRGLKWKEKDAVSTSQLQQMKANRKNWK
ncbi:hypothetical protein H5410_026457 [Solanum commersonii]|uniref:Transposon MuDR mudrA n=1 Tax=Solanum commersonii TaxID=4109 RepID=A0A9J5YYN6_SOLCO|nr:hypothetical protein H5410_026457 [Solanum commersonii]